MAPLYKQMNQPQRNTRKALIGQVSSLLVKKKFPGVAGPKLIPNKPAAEVKGAVASLNSPNYRMPYQGAKPGIGFHGPKKHGKHRPRTGLGNIPQPGQKVKY